MTLDTTGTRTQPRPAISPTVPLRRPLAVVTGWSMTSVVGSRPDDLAAAVRDGSSRAVAVADEVGGGLSRACYIEDFDARAELGRKGIRTLDRATLLAIATIARLGPAVVDPAQRDEPGPSGVPAVTGLVMGTGAGSVQSTMDFTRDALTGDRPYLVDPARFPNTVMNFAAGQCAIWYGLRGPNATVTTGRATGIAALRYAARWLRLGHADRVIVTATEELTAQRSRLEQATAPDGVEPLVGEGCCALVVEPPRAHGAPGEVAAAGSGGEPIAELLAVTSALAPRPHRVADLLERCVAELLDGLDPAEHVAVHAPFDARPGSAERRAVALALPGHPVETLDVAAVLGDTGSVAALFQVQAVIAALRTAPGGPDPAALAVVTSVDAEGVVSALLVRAVGTP